MAFLLNALVCRPKASQHFQASVYGRARREAGQFGVYIYKTPLRDGQRSTVTSGGATAKSQARQRITLSFVSILASLLTCILTF